MRRLAPLAAVIALAAGCGPTGVSSPAASASPSPVPSAAGPASATPAASASTLATPTPSPITVPVPVTIKMTIDGKPANVAPLAYLLPVLVIGNTSFFWNVGTLAKRGEENVGQGYGLLKEGEGNVTLHMKIGGATTGAKALRTLTDAEFKGAVNMTYKEGPKNLTWYANAQNFSTGSFTVEAGVVTFKLTATIAGDAKANDGTTRKFDIEIVGLPTP